MDTLLYIDLVCYKLRARSKSLLHNSHYYHMDKHDLADRGAPQPQRIQLIHRTSFLTLNPSPHPKP